MFLVVLRQSGPEFDRSRPLEEQSGWSEHAAYMDGLVDDGFIVLGALRQAAGLGEDQFQPEFAPARTGELQRSSLDVTRARAELGFTADTDLVAGMKPTLDWARAAAAS